VYSATLGLNALNISVKPIQSSVSFKGIVSLLIFCLDDLSIAVSGVLRSPTIIVILSLSFFDKVSLTLLLIGSYIWLLPS